MASASLGVEAGSHASLAIAGETLFYLSRVGIMAYTGGIPESIAQQFGTVRYADAVGGSDGRKYYVSMHDSDGEWSLFVYDTQFGMWHREDALQVVGFAWNADLYFLDASGTLWLNGDARTVPEGATQEVAVQSVAEFGEFVEDNPNKKITAKLQMRLELAANTELKIYMEFDSSGTWELVDTLTTEVLRSYYIPIVPRRADHFKLKFEGTGHWVLYSLVIESAIGSELRSTAGRQ